MIIQFVDTHGRPAVDATVCVVDSPQPFPDLGLITDKSGEVEIEIPQTGTYSFAIYVNGQLHRIAAQLNRSDRRLSLTLK